GFAAVTELISTRGKIMAQSVVRKTLSFGEGGLAIVFAITTLLSLFAAAKAVDAPFGFHAFLAAAASAAALFAIFDRYLKRPNLLPPAEIDGRPNYNLGPI